MDKVTTIAVDLAKRVFSAYWVDAQSGEISAKTMTRVKFEEFMRTRAPARVVLETGGSAHHWGRWLERQGHAVRLIAAQHVRPFVRTNKTDGADARAIWEAAQRPLAVPGIGTLTASALSAELEGSAQSYGNGRQYAACKGMAPRLSGTGGKVHAGAISKRGDPYVRTLLIHGARSVITHQRRAQRLSPWLAQLLARRPFNVAVVALANKMARTAWALAAHGRTYQQNYGAQAA